MWQRFPRFPPSPVTLCLHLHYSADPPLWASAEERVSKVFWGDFLLVEKGRGGGFHPFYFSTESRNKCLPSMVTKYMACEVRHWVICLICRNTNVCAANFSGYLGQRAKVVMFIPYRSLWLFYPREKWHWKQPRTLFLSLSRNVHYGRLLLVFNFSCALFFAWV